MSRPSAWPEQRKDGAQMEYTKRLKDLRKAAKESQTDVGKLIGTTQTQYWKYEAGEQEISVKRLIILAKHYGVSTDYILGLTDIPTPYPPAK